MGEEYVLKSYRLKGEIEHSKVFTDNCTSLKHIWETYLKIDVLWLGFVCPTHALEM